MPELPEVETLALELDRALGGQRISRVEIRNESLLETPREGWGARLRGRRILQIGRRGKYIRIDLSRNSTLWFHLGMTGQLLLASFPPSSRSHTHFILSFSDSSKRLFYRDVRRFGRIHLTPTREAQWPKGVRRLGLEPGEWKAEAFASSLKVRRARIKNLLLNQSLVAGLGNIYSDEALHRAGIHPFRRAHTIGRRRLLGLHKAIGEVLEEALQWGGSSIEDYLHLDGTRGRFQDFHQVYGRAGEGCRTCGASIETLKLSGRTSSFCPRCQG